MKSYTRMITQRRSDFDAFCKPVIQEPNYGTPSLGLTVKSLPQTKSAFPDKIDAGGMKCLEGLISLEFYEPLSSTRKAL